MEVSEALSSVKPELYDRKLTFRDTGDGLVVSLKDYFLGNHHHTETIFTGAALKQSRAAKRVEQRTFEDLKFIRVVSGKGGNGSVSFFRDAHRPVGPPDGGDGGDGGDVYIRVVKSVSSLHKIKRSYQAGDGAAGTGSQLDGKHGTDVIIEVPVGTTIRWIPDPQEIRQLLKEKDMDDIHLKLDAVDDGYDIRLQFYRDSFEPGHGWIFKENDEDHYRNQEYFQELNNMVIPHDQEIITEEVYADKFPILGMDFDKPTDKPVRLLKGGKGGMGNMHFLTKNIRNPRFAKVGRAGLTGIFLLELKLIADLGLVGLPNAGKSTLLRAISKARPRVGHWDFTTLQPTIGTIFTTIDRDPFTVADIPGIIKGASQNKGMGLDFLRHIERSGGLVFVVSLTTALPVEDLRTLMEEVGPSRMDNKRILVIATKADLTEGPEAYEELRDFVESHGWKITVVSALNQQGVEGCIQLMSEAAATT